MLRPRIIPVLLIHNKGLVKTVKFSVEKGKYVGDPINAVKIFNEKEADELMIIDIDATVENKEPNYSLIEKIANESRMPLCYGGGIKTNKQAQKILSLGVEKISISYSAINNPDLIYEIANDVGNQSVVVTIDVKKKLFGGYDIYTHNAIKKHKISLKEYIIQIQELGCGEIVINSIDNDGIMKGYDMKLVEFVKPLVKVPLTILGGMGSLEDIKQITNKFGIIGCGVGSFFVFKGKYKAVLINYPSWQEREKLFGDEYV